MLQLLYTRPVLDASITRRIISFTFFMLRFFICSYAFLRSSLFTIAFRCHFILISRPPFALYFFPLDFIINIDNFIIDIILGAVLVYYNFFLISSLLAARALMALE